MASELARPRGRWWFSSSTPARSGETAMHELPAESPSTDGNRLVLDVEALRFQMLKEFLTGFTPCLAIAHLGLHFLRTPSSGTYLLALTQWLALALSWVLLCRVGSTWQPHCSAPCAVR
jgi:hypothetical protein